MADFLGAVDVNDFGGPGLANRSSNLGRERLCRGDDLRNGARMPTVARRLGRAPTDLVGLVLR
jgi:hypothetical protein